MITRSFYRHKKQGLKEGFTLIELLIYIAISTMLLGTVVSLFFTFGRARSKQQAVSEVESQGASAMNLITQTVRNTEAVLTPSTSATTTSLSVSTAIFSTTPSVFDLANKTLRLTEGISAPINLTNSQVVVTNLSFQNLKGPFTSDSVRIQFTISYATTSNSRFDQNYSATFYDTATLRQF